MKTFKFTDEERIQVLTIIKSHFGVLNSTLLDRIEQIVSERITHEPETIKPYHEHGNSVASDRTESGQRAEDVLDQYILNDYVGSDGMRGEFALKEDVIKAMHAYASQVCADKEREINEWKIQSYSDNYLLFKLESEIDRLNESLTVMLRKNAELEAQIDQFTNPLRIK